MEDELNQKIADLVISMSDIVVYVVEVKQFATIEQFIKVINEANALIDRTVNSSQSIEDVVLLVSILRLT